MGRLLILFMTFFFLVSCNEPQGTTEFVNKEDKNSKIEVYRYWYGHGSYVYVSRFKDEPNVQTTTWTERQGKTTVTKSNVVIYENDSIQIIRK